MKTHQFYLKTIRPCEALSNLIIIKNIMDLFGANSNNNITKTEFNLIFKKIFEQVTPGITALYYN